ncbi:MAG: kelch repeat-containing protein, partial [Candidatus Asgardarchaeia archaeon]
DEGYSYVDVTVAATKIPEEDSITENLEIYSVYDENEKTDRHVGAIFNLTLDYKDEIVTLPNLVDEPSVLDEDAEIIEETPFSSTMARYNISDNEWVHVPGMSENRGDSFIGVVGNKIYVMGGLKNNSLDVSNKNEIYDILTETWTTGPPMLSHRFGGMSVVVNNDIYLIGGIGADSTSGGQISVSSLVEVYHTDTGAWEQLSDMPSIGDGGAWEEKTGVALGAAQYCDVLSNNYIYIIGGIQDAVISSSNFSIRNYNKRILRYSIGDDSWEYSGALRTNELNTYQRIFPLTLIYDNKIIVFNGAIESDDQFIYPIEDFYINIAQSFTVPSSGEWINFGSGLLGDFPIPKFQSAMVRYDLDPSTYDTSDYYIMGGANDDDSSLDILEKISIQGSTVSYLSSYDDNPSLAMASLLKAKHGASAVYSGVTGTPYIYLVGGYTTAREESTVDIIFDI